MGFMTSLFLAAILGLVTLASAKPIMVSFGTNQGPIVPRQKSTNLQPRAYVDVDRSPAPVSEDREDVPNPSTYRPLVPHQYRSKLYSYRPPVNLILGTPLDQKYTPSLEKYDLYKKHQARSLGIDYTGPHVFEKQDYEYYDALRRQKTTLQPSTQYDRPQYYQPIDKRYNAQDSGSKSVPQIGIVYSAGVRYYVPQIVYYNQADQKNSKQQNEEENSVYDEQDEKYFHYSVSQ